MKPEIISRTPQTVESENDLRETLFGNSDDNQRAAVSRLYERRGVLNGLMRNRMEKEIDNLNLEALRSYRKRCEIALEEDFQIRLAVARKKGEGLIQMIGLETHSRVAQSAQEHFDALSAMISERRLRFAAQIVPQLEYLRSVEYLPALYLPLKDSVDKHIKSYLSGIDEILVRHLQQLEVNIGGSRAKGKQL